MRPAHAVRFLQCSKSSEVIALAKMPDAADTWEALRPENAEQLRLEVSCGVVSQNLPVHT